MNDRETKPHTKSTLKIASFVIQGLYTLACIVMMILSGVFHNALGTKLAYELLDVLINMSVWLCVIPAMPVSLVLNILAFPKGEGNREKTHWLIWIISSPVLYIAVFVVSVMVFLSSTVL